MLKVGNKAPDFNLKDQNGDKVSLSNFLGQKVVIWFYPKANTPGWTIEGQGFRDEFNSFKKLNIQILGVSADPIEKQKSFAEKQDFNYPLLSDENHAMLKAYEAWGLKKFMGREYEGIFRISYLIDENGIIEKVFEKVKTKTHANDILNMLK